MKMAELTRKNLARYAGRMNALSDATPAPLCGQCNEPPAMSDLEEFKAEKNNGFILWTRLHEDFKGSGEMVEFAGVDTLRLYPSCSKISEVTAHLDGWKELLDLYGSSEDVESYGAQHYSERTEDGNS